MKIVVRLYLVRITIFGSLVSSTYCCSISRMCMCHETSCKLEHHTFEQKWQILTAFMGWVTHMGSAGGHEWQEQPRQGILIRCILIYCMVVLSWRLERAILTAKQRPIKLWVYWIYLSDLSALKSKQPWLSGHTPCLTRLHGQIQRVQLAGQ
jgi:hypothetical protein